MIDQLGHHYRRHKARKAHTCSWCKSEIQPGATYLVVIQLPHVECHREGDGSYDWQDVEFGTQKICRRCEARHQADLYGYDDDDYREMALERAYPGRL